MIKAKHIKTKYTSNVDKMVDDNYPIVAKYSYRRSPEDSLNPRTNGSSRFKESPNRNDKEGFVTTVNTFHPHFNHVQFAKSILDNYHKKVEELSKLVTIYYYNIDAFIIDEDDYNKLVGLGMIGENLGQFKVESVFDELVFKSPRTWMGLMENGEIYCRPKSLINKYNYEEFKNLI
jgi:hypothetical protein